MTYRTLLLAAALTLTAETHLVLAEEADPRTVLQSAVALWHLRDANDAAGKDSRLTPHGSVRFGVPLPGPERDASVARGGDGHVAMLDGGWLDAGQGADRELQLTGDQLTALIRLRAPTPTAWTTRGFFTKGGGHDRLVFNFFSHDFQRGPEQMRVGCEIGIEGKPGLGGQVTAPVGQIGPTDWHDLIVRYDGRELVLFVDGVPLDRQPAHGTLRPNTTEPVSLGAGTSQGNTDVPFPCQVDHAAVWNRALSDAEIAAVSGGADAVGQRRAAFAKYVPPPIRPSTTELVDQARRLKEQFQADRSRPRYHFLIPEEGEIMPGDPNGAIWWKGRYHLFYIFQRRQSAEPPVVHCWGHASSIDLLHWEHHPTALDVAPGDPDRGIFSGNALVTREGVPLILYHGVNAGNSIALAQDDRLIRWKKSPANPIVPLPKPGDANFGKFESWDPHGWLEGDTYYAIFGGAKPALFQGPDMTQLRYVGPFLENDRWSEAGEDISCPDFFPLGKKHVLLCISHRRGARYFVGEWRDERFVAESHARMNWPGGGFFAPETLVDDRGRRLLWAWCLDERPPAARVASGWSGVMSLPRVLSLADDHTLRVTPPEELQKLRHLPRHRENLVVAPGAPLVLDDLQGDSMEITVEMRPPRAGSSGVLVRRTPDGAEQTAIIYDATQGLLRVDVLRSTLDPTIRYRSWCIFRPTDADDAERRVTSQDAPLRLAPDEPLKLRIFLDRSMLEVFANDRQCVTQRLWPTRADALGVALFSEGGAAQVARVDAWDMAATQPE